MSPNMSMLVSELSEYEQYISKYSYITVKMMIRKFKIAPKMAHRILRFSEQTMLCSPIEYGSNKHVNYNLYKLVSQKELYPLCKTELATLKKNKYDSVSKECLNNYIYSDFERYMMNKYRVSIGNDILSQLVSSSS